MRATTERLQTSIENFSYGYDILGKFGKQDGILKYQNALEKFNYNMDKASEGLDAGESAERIKSYYDNAYQAMEQLGNLELERLNKTREAEITTLDRKSEE